MPQHPPPDAGHAPGPRPGASPPGAGPRPHPLGHVVTFRLAGQDCALRREAVREVLPLPRLARPPGLPAPVEGVLNLGGRPVPVLDPAFLLGGEVVPPAPSDHLLLLAAGPVPLALRVQRVLDVVDASGLELRPLPPGHSPNGVAEAEIGLGGRFVHLLDAGRLLLEGEAAALARLADELDRRRALWTADAAGGAGA